MGFWKDVRRGFRVARAAREAPPWELREIAREVLGRVDLSAAEQRLHDEQRLQNWLREQRLPANYEERLAEMLRRSAADNARRKRRYGNDYEC